MGVGEQDQVEDEEEDEEDEEDDEDGGEEDEDEPELDEQDEEDDIDSLPVLEARKEQQGDRPGKLLNFVVICSQKYNESKVIYVQ